MRASRLAYTLLAFVIAFVTSPAFAQQRDAGQFVVPIGYEGVDSVRLSLTNMTEVRAQVSDPAPGGPYIDSVADEFQANFEGAWGGLDPLVIAGNRRGSMARSGVMSSTEMPIQPRRTLPRFFRSGRTSLAMSMGSAKPMP